jgi:hypothetical protein
MEKECDQCGVKYDTKNKKQKYCSVECQHNSYRKKTVERVKVCCQYCGSEFEERKHKVEKYGVKYCNKKCADLHKKTTYLKEGNPAFGTKRTEKQKNNASIRSKKLWGNEEYRNKIKNHSYHLNAGKQNILMKNKCNYWLHCKSRNTPKN